MALEVSVLDYGYQRSGYFFFTCTVLNYTGKQLVARDLGILSLAPFGWRLQVQS